VAGSGTSRTSPTGGISAMSISSSRTFRAVWASVLPMPSLSFRSRIETCTALAWTMPE
jgi:hypothetical protein